VSGDRASLGLTPVASSKSRDNADRKAAKKAVAAEKAIDRRKLGQGKAPEKAKAVRDKAIEKGMLSALKTQLSSPKASLVQDPVEIHEVHVPSPSETEIIKGSSLAHSDKTFSVKKSVKTSDLTANKRPETTVTSPRPFTQSKDYFLSHQSSEISQLPLLSKKPKKTKPVIKVVKGSKEGEAHYEDLNLAFPREMSHVADDTANPSSSTSRSQSLDRHSLLTSVEELLEGLDVSSNPFFDLQRLSAPVKMPLEYGPLVHALSALSVGGTSAMPSGSIDNAVSSFQQLLETLTQTISELLRLLPRTTWDDSSSFNGVFHDMLKGDDFLDDGEDGSGKDEVAALTLALERRARWMEVQLSKLEELHRDINTAAVRAILSFNDNGWDQHTFLPRIGNTLLRFEHIAMMEEGGALRPMTADELEKKLAVAKEAATFAETEIREAMERFQNQARE
jgi:CCR4-NOT transcription complex subunit 4